MKQTIFISTLMLIIFSMITNTVSAQIQKDDILGLWITEGGKSVVKVFKKDDGKYYAKIVWLKEPNGEDGKPKKDTKNPDETLQSREIKGMEFMIGFTWDPKEKEWAGDNLYDPESGNTYSGYLSLKEENLLHLRGYVGVPMFGRTSVWMRKPDK